MSLKEKEREFKKNIISEAAYQLFSAKPVESVNMDEIARLVGCAKGTLYLYFHNKDDLLNHLVVQGLQKLCTDMEEQCLNNDDTHQTLNNYLALQYYFFKEYNTLLSSWLRRQLDNKIKPEWIAEINSILGKKMQIVAEILEEGIRAGDFIPADSWQLANLMESVLREVTFPFINKEPQEKSESNLKLLESVLSYGIITRDHN